MGAFVYQDETIGPLELVLSQDRTHTVVYRTGLIFDIPRKCNLTKITMREKHWVSQHTWWCSRSNISRPKTQLCKEQFIEAWTNKSRDLWELSATAVVDRAYDDYLIEKFSEGNEEETREERLERLLVTDYVEPTNFVRDPNETRDERKCRLGIYNCEKSKGALDLA